MDKSKSYISIQRNNNIFSNSWLYYIPLDLSSSINSNYSYNEKEYNSNLNDKELDKNIIKYLPKSLINIIFEDDSESSKEESFSNNIINYDYFGENVDYKNTRNTNLKKIEEEKKIENVRNSINTVNKYNINIYNPYINMINIYYPSSINSLNDFSPSCCDQNLNSNYILNKYSSYINDSVINNNFNIDNNYNSVRNSNIYINKQEKVEFSNINTINIKNKEQGKKKKTKKPKKHKKNKKKKLDNDYTIEIFGRRGWICENCHNFNYESRKTCNRCKIVKTAIKKSVLLTTDDGNKILNNLMNGENKKEWNCKSCGNINYSFRIICNRCQIPKEIVEENKFETEIN